MIHSYKSLEAIPTENIKEDLISFSNSISTISINSIKHFRDSYETFQPSSKNNSGLKSLLSSLSDYLNNFIEMSQFIDNLSFELWDFYHMKQLFFEKAFFNLILLSLWVFEINILDYVNRLLLGGDNSIDLSKVFIQKTETNIWNAFKYSNYYVNLKENIEKKLEEKNFCLKNNLEILKNYQNLNENLSRLIKEITNNDFLSEITINTIYSALISLLKLILKQYEQNDKVLGLKNLLIHVIIAFDLEKWFFWDIAQRKSKFNLEERANDGFLNEFRRKEEEIKLNEKLLLFLKKIKK